MDGSDAGDSPPVDFDPKPDVDYKKPVFRKPIVVEKRAPSARAAKSRAKSFKRNSDEESDEEMASDAGDDDAEYRGDSKADVKRVLPHRR